MFVFWELLKAIVRNTGSISILYTYFQFKCHGGFLCLKPPSRTQLLPGLNLWPLASTRIALAAQPWWHRSPFCHTSLIASPHSAHLYSTLIPLWLVSATSLKKRHFLLSCLGAGNYQKTSQPGVFDSHEEQLPFLSKDLEPRVCSRKLLLHKKAN